MCLAMLFGSLTAARAQVISGPVSSLPGNRSTFQYTSSAGSNAANWPASYFWRLAGVDSVAGIARSQWATTGCVHTASPTISVRWATTANVGIVEVRDGNIRESQLVAAHQTQLGSKLEAIAKGGLVSRSFVFCVPLVCVMPSGRCWRPPLPPQPVTGRPRADNRRTLDAMLLVLRSGCRWGDVPRELGDGSTAWRRLPRGAADGTRQRLWRVFLASLHTQQQLRWAEAVLAGTFVPARNGGTASASRVRAPAPG